MQGSHGEQVKYTNYSAEEFVLDSVNNEKSAKSFQETSDLFHICILETHSELSSVGVDLRRWGSAKSYAER